MFIKGCYDIWSLVTYVDDVLLEDAVRSLLVVGDDELVALRLDPFTEAKLHVGVNG